VAPTRHESQRLFACERDFHFVAAVPRVADGLDNERAQSHTRSPRESDRRAPRKRLGDSVERYAIVRIVECRYKNDTIRDVEVRVLAGSRSPFMITGLGKGMVTIRNGCFFATASRRRMLSTDRAWFSSAVSCSYAGSPCHGS